MTHKASPNLLRVKFSRLWKHVWCNDINHSTLMLEDIRLKLLIRKFFKMIFFKLLDINIIRLPNFISIRLVGIIELKDFDFGSDGNLTKLSVRYAYFLGELKTQIFNSFGYSNVCIFYRLFFFGYKRYFRKNTYKISKYRFFRNPVNLAEMFANHFKRKRRRPQKHIFGVSKALFKKRKMLRKRIYGVKVRLSGPLGAPRNRKHKTITRLFGDMPANTLHSYIDFHQTVGVSKFGSFGIKVWVYKGLRSLLFSGKKNKSPCFSFFKTKSFYLRPTKFPKAKRVYIQKYLWL